MSPRFRALAHLLLLFCAPVASAEPTTTRTPEGGTSTATEGSTTPKTLKKRLKLTYFTFFNGPGLHDFYTTPNLLGNKADKGWIAKTHLSVGYRLNERIAIDYQLKLNQVVSNQYAFQNDGGKLGISGILLQGSDWDLKGAFNSDIPGFGDTNVQRTLLLDPGLFAQLRYRPRDSRWSLYTLVMPRVYFYSDRMAMDDRSLYGGFKPGDKPLVQLEFEPTLNYALTDKAGLRTGMKIEMRQNANSDSLKRWFWPVDFGYTYAFNEKLNLYPNIRVSTPLDDSIRASQKSAANWVDTFSFGLWINGTIL